MLTTIWGVEVAGGDGMNASETFIDGYSVSTSGVDWNMDHLNVVAFVYDVATFEVIQAEQVKIIP